MVQQTWQSRFLVIMILTSALFIAVFGWIIYKERMYDAAAIQANFTNNPAALNAQTYLPAPASTPAYVKEMYSYVGSHNQQTNKHNTQRNQVTSKEFIEGYQWAQAHQVTNSSQCQQLSDDRHDGCINYIEVNQYLAKTSNF